MVEFSASKKPAPRYFLFMQGSFSPIYIGIHPMKAPTPTAQNQITAIPVIHSNGYEDFPKMVCMLNFLLPGAASNCADIEVALPGSGFRRRPSRPRAANEQQFSSQHPSRS